MLPASAVDAEAQVRLAMADPSVVSPEVRAMEQSEPSAVSRSNLTVQAGLVLPTMLAAKVVLSLP